MDLFGQTPTQLILFFILYGITGAMPFFAAVYLLLRRGNAFAPDVTPPVRLRRWASAFFAVAALGHVWWYLFFIYSRDLQSASYVVVGVLDCVALLTTIAGTLLAMLQDRKRPVWPAFAAPATLCWIDVDPKTEGISNGVANVRAMPVMIQNNGNILNISGVHEGSMISVYDLSLAKW